ITLRHQMLKSTSAPRRPRTARGDLSVLPWNLPHPCFTSGRLVLQCLPGLISQLTFLTVLRRRLLQLLLLEAFN
ncbi:hypothetical protein NDU88_001525, partial [Pleurodeles waltl]